MEYARLNITARERTSRLPWRGQFSPELVEYLLDTVCANARVVLDPFCGSGTVMFESALRGIYGVGTEVNPAAWQLASMACLSQKGQQRLKLLRAEFQAAGRYLVSEMTASVPSERACQFLRAIQEEENPELKVCLSAAFLLAMGNKPDLSLTSTEKAMVVICRLLTEMSSYTGSAECYLSDARNVPVDSGTVEAVITSPPYINVFNYHQNYRPAAEMLGWRPLAAAKSEFGSNRKHRQNRFLTVVQYCLDMAQALDEIARVCKPGAPVVLVVGRESNVLGTYFHNSRLLMDLFNQSPSFELLQSNERVFKNRFGQNIYEDVLIARALNDRCIDLAFVHDMAAKALKEAIDRVPEKSKDALCEAYGVANTVRPSPIFQPLTQTDADIA